MKPQRGVAYLQEALLEELTPHMSGLGFRARNAQQSYVQDVPLEVRIVHVGVVRHSTDVDATIDLAIRVVPVGQMLTAVGYDRGEGATLGAELGNIVDGRPCRWTVENRDDCPLAAAAMAELLRKFGLPWFERHVSLQKVLDLLVANDRASFLYSPVHVKRCLSAVALAKYLGATSNVSKVARQCREFLESGNDPQLRVFDHYAPLLLEA